MERTLYFYLWRVTKILVWVRWELLSKVKWAININKWFSHLNSFNHLSFKEFILNSLDRVTYIRPKCNSSSKTSHNSSEWFKDLIQATLGCMYRTHKTVCMGNNQVEAVMWECICLVVQARTWHRICHRTLLIITIFDSEQLVIYRTNTYDMLVKSSPITFNYKKNHKYNLFYY